MEWCRRSSKLFSDVFRWKIGLPRNSVQKPLSRTSFSSKPLSRTFFSSSPKLNTSYKIRVNYIGQWKKPFDAKRFYNGGPQQQQWNQRIQKIANRVSGFLAFVTLSLIINNKFRLFVFPNIQIELIEKRFKGKVVHKIHPDSMMFQMTLQRIIEEAPIGYYVSNVCSEDNCDNEDMVLDYKWVEYGRNMGHYHGQGTDLEMFEWELFLVDEPDVVDAFCLPGGKIVVFTGLLKHFRTPSEIAAIIGHQVGHVVSKQYHQKQVSRENQWWIIVKTISELFLVRHPFSPREEMEADSIGLLLAAGAGYDPSVAPRVYEKLSTFDGDYNATHSSGKKSAQHFAQAKVMENAIYIYDKVKKEESCINARFYGYAC